MDDKVITQIKALREGGQVKRCHTFPIIGEYNVGKHSFDACNLLLILHPNPSIDLIKAILWHDVAERWTGDIPATAKWCNEELAVSSRVMEENTMINLGLNGPFEALDNSVEVFDGEGNRGGYTDEDWIRAVDRLELWLWAIEQILIGNSYASLIKERVEKWFSDNWNDFPIQCREFYESYNSNRLEDNIYATL